MKKPLLSCSLPLVLFAALCAAPAAALHPAAEKESPLRLKGGYLAYSYDLNHLYGENVEAAGETFEIQARYLTIDLNSRICRAFGAVSLVYGDERNEGDEIVFALGRPAFRLTSYTETATVREFGETQILESLPDAAGRAEITLPAVRDSFIHFTAAAMTLTAAFEIVGHEATLYVGGVESLTFKRLNLSQGMKIRAGGFSLDRVWYSRSQGLTARAAFHHRDRDILTGTHQIHIEERSILKDYPGAPRQVDLMSSTSLRLGPDANLSLTANLNTGQSYSSRLLFSRKWTDAVSMRADLSLDKPVHNVHEIWAGLGTDIGLGQWGVLRMAGRYELEGQILASAAFNARVVSNLHMGLAGTYSQLNMGGRDQKSRIATGAFSLDYRTRMFNLSSDYQLNWDLFGNQLLSQPHVNFALNPVVFYSGLLRLHFSNRVFYSRLSGGEQRSSMAANNTAMNLTTETLGLGSGLTLSAGLSAEQFLETERRNITSGGGTFRLGKAWGPNFGLELLYSLQSRRKTKNWFIEGTTSQDMSAVVRYGAGQPFSGWVSVSYDPKTDKLRQSFADCSLDITRNWTVHAMAYYDFLFGRLDNIDISVIRKVGRFNLRFMWRSLSRQFQVDLVPG